MSHPVSTDGGRGQDQNWTVLSMLEWATAYFEKKGVSNPRLSIEWLLSDLLGVKRLDLYLQFDRPLTTDQLTTLREWVLKRGKKEPLQYITGSTDFYRCKIMVDKRVLIPRPETEELVEMILTENQDETRTLVDFGTGSGCIAIAVKKARPTWIVIGVDIDGEALDLARKNALANNVEVEWVEGDMRTASMLMEGRHADIVVSNPPYILPAESESLESEVRDFEPSVALFHDDPVSLYLSLTKFAEGQAPPAIVYCEIHYGFGKILLGALQNPGWEVLVSKDYTGKDRFLKATFVGLVG